MENLKDAECLFCKNEFRKSQTAILMQVPTYNNRNISVCSNCIKQLSNQFKYVKDFINENQEHLISNEPFDLEIPEELLDEDDGEYADIDLLSDFVMFLTSILGSSISEDDFNSIIAQKAALEGRPAKEIRKELEAYRQIDLINKPENQEKVTQNRKSKNKKKLSLTPQKINDFLNKRVIGQDNAKKIISVAIYNHYKRITSDKTNIQKSNILMVGPSGVGKTEIARTIADLLNVPFAIADATTVTEAGYVGDDVENILLKLIQAADGDIEKAEHGIIYIDEIDKIARAGENVSITRDVSGEGVQQALLKIIEGAVVDVPVSGGRKHPYGDTCQIDTSNILFICGGAFEGLTMKPEVTRGTLGFGERQENPEENKIDAKAIIKQGMIPELVGRLPIIVKLDALTENDLKRILVEPENSIIKQYIDLLALDNVKLSYTNEVLSYIAKKAMKNKTGARGLRSIIEDSMVDIMYEIPSDRRITEVILDVKDDNITHTYIKKSKKTV